jgi:hypothetical protein
MLRKIKKNQQAFDTRLDTVWREPLDLLEALTAVAIQVSRALFHFS